MKLLRRVMLATVLLSLLAAMGSVARAEDDPPGRVARLQYMSGSVSVQPRGTEDWVAGTLNRPLTTSDNIWTDKDSRAELNVGGAVLRMNAESSLTLTNISDNTVQVELHQGTLNLRVRKLYGGEIYEVDTPNMAFTVQKGGEYRFDTGFGEDATTVTVFHGQGDATGDGPAVRVRAHEQARFTAGTSLRHSISEAPGLDGFDDWCRVRNQREDHALSARYVSPGVIGYEDLDEYGSWRVLPSYGPVWVPTVVETGWAPYRYGHWVWISPWGWTWVDDSPWGFAPFHYGRWVYYNNYWGWAPGPFYARPVYAPALVFWFGGGGGFGFSFGSGYGWCPLGFGEPFIPWYRGSRNYFRNVNITNTRITNITNITNNYYNNTRVIQPGHYANFRAPGAVTAVPRRAFEESLPVHKNFVAVSAKDLANARVERNVELTPTRQSILGGNAGRPSAVPPQRVFSRPVVTKLTPPTPQPRGGTMSGAPINKAERVPGQPGEGRSVSAPAPGRVMPQPGQRVETPENRGVAGRNVPRPPSASAGPAQPGPANQERFPRSSERTSERAPVAVPRPGAAVEPSPQGNPRSVPEGVRSGEPREPVQRSEPQRSVPRPPEGARVSQGERSTPSSPRAVESPRMAEPPRGQQQEMPRRSEPAPQSHPSGSAQPATRAPERDSHPNSNRPADDKDKSPHPQQGPPKSPTANRYVPRPSGPVVAASYSARGNDSASRYIPRESSPRVGGSERFGSYEQRSSSRESPRYSNSSPAWSAPRYSSAPTYRASAPSYRGSVPAYRSAGPSYHSSTPASRGSSSRGSSSQGSSPRGSSRGHSGRG